MTKGILIVGGGILQIPALIRAKEMGLVTHLTDGSEQCYGRNFSDFFHHLDIRDLAGHVALAKELLKTEEIEAVYTQGTDVAYTVAYTAAHVGLPGVNPEAAQNCNDKIRMRQVLAQHDINDTVFAFAANLADFINAVRHVGFPCYVKPADNSASRGIVRLTSEDEVEKVFTEALQACYFRKTVLVEREILGEEYSVDTVMSQGILYPAGISDRVFLNKENFAIQAGSRTPSLLESSKQKQMYDKMAVAASALGVTVGAFKGDMVVTPDGEVKIIEVAARTSGGFDSQYRKPLSFGIDIIKATIDIARGLPLDARDLIPNWVKWSSTLSVFPKPGKVEAIEGLEIVKNMSGVSKVIMLCQVGDIIEPYTDCAKRTNYIISVADTLEQLKILEKKIYSTLIITTRPI